VDPQLWNSSFSPIPLFGQNKYLKGNSKNIICSLLRIVVAFIKQDKLKNKFEKDISQIAGFGYATWLFLLVIYESR